MQPRLSEIGRFGSTSPDSFLGSQLSVQHVRETVQKSHRRYVAHANAYQSEGKFFVEDFSVDASGMFSLFLCHFYSRTDASIPNVIRNIRRTVHCVSTKYASTRSIYRVPQMMICRQPSIKLSNKFFYFQKERRQKMFWKFRWFIAAITDSFSCSQSVLCFWIYGIVECRSEFLLFLLRPPFFQLRRTTRFRRLTVGWGMGKGECFGNFNRNPPILCISFLYLQALTISCRFVHSFDALLQK